MLRINNEIFLQFIEKVSLRGLIDEFSLIFDVDGCKTRCHNDSSTVLVVALLKKEAFSEYSAIKDRISFSGSGKLLSLLRNIRGDIEIDVDLEKNVAKFKSFGSGLKISIITVPLLDNEYSSSYSPTKVNLTYSGSFVLRADFFESLLKFSKTIGDTNAVMKCSGNKLTTMIGNSKMVNVKSEHDISYKDFMICLGMPFFIVLPVLTLPVSVSASTDYPLTLLESNDNFKVKYIIAPMMESDK